MHSKIGLPNSNKYNILTISCLVLLLTFSSIVSGSVSAQTIQVAPNPCSTTDLAENYLSTTCGQTINVATNPALVVPAIIKQPGETFLVTPTIAKIFPGLTVLLNQTVKAPLASLEQIQMKFAENGTNVRFSFSVSGTVPISLPLPTFSPSSTVPSALAIPQPGFSPSSTVPISLPLPPSSSNSSSNTSTNSSSSTNTNSSSNSISVLFLDINSTGQVVQPFTSPAAFESSPSIEILVNKTADITKLNDGSGCPDIQLSTFNETSANWQTLSKPTRTASIDTPVACGFTLETGHFSKFAVGGVRSLAPSLL